MVPFVRALVPFFAGQQPQASESTAPATAGSSPQRDAPPQVVLGATKWLPRPSFRTLALAGAVAAYYVARHNHKGVHAAAA